MRYVTQNIAGTTVGESASVRECTSRCQTANKYFSREILEKFPFLYNKLS